MMRCLIVDDSDVVRKVAGAICARLGFAVEEAESAADGLERCTPAAPDVVLLDWHMPGMSGIEFLVELRRLGLARRPHVIYCTSENDPLDISRAFLCGANDYLEKPFTRDMLEVKLAAIGQPARVAGPDSGAAVAA